MDWLMRPVVGFFQMLVTRPPIAADHSEGAWRRTAREFHELATNTVRFPIWGVVWSGACTLGGLALAWGDKEWATMGITAAGLAVGLFIGVGVPFLWLRLTAVRVQRNEARNQLKEPHPEVAAPDADVASVAIEIAQAQGSHVERIISRDIEIVLSPGEREIGPTDINLEE
jgi:hypothetical protein